MNKPKRKKAIWTQLVKRKPDAKAARQRAYRKRAVEWIEDHWVCRAWFNGVRCDVRATQVHHKHGRLGALLMDESLWVPVCAKGHDWIHRNIEEARKLGLYAPKGQWNRKP